VERDPAEALEALTCGVAKLERIRTGDGSMGTPRAVGYTRVSTAEQVDGFGLELQETAIRRACHDAGFRLLSVETDEGRSGDNGVDGRRGLYDVLAAIEAREADVLVVYSLDRIARRVAVQEAVLERVWASGATVYSAGDGGEIPRDDPDDPVRTAMREMRAVFARLERGLIAKRMRDGRRVKAQRGGYAGGRPAYGLRAEGKELVTDPDEATVVRRVQELRGQGASYRRVCAVLAAEGHRPRRGEHWAPSVVRDIAIRGGHHACE
jgi:DNA invertase Pin-like site-specific DNA recombinase